MPRNYIPCCLPTGSLLATRAIQMFEEFRGNLLRAKGEPAKTQTIRGWKTARAKAHKQSFLEGKWIRVWRGQGNKDTIGWLRINVWDTVKVGSIDQGDCVWEGRPSWGPDRLRTGYFKGYTPEHVLIRVGFEFRACHACMNY